MDNIFNKYRQHLMGVSVIWIFFFHAQINVETWFSPIKAIKSLGFSGVDIFFLLSGYGVFCSLKNNDSLVFFLKKRLIRVLPAFWLAKLLYWLASLFVFGVARNFSIWSLIGLDFVVFGNGLTWFVPAILMSYALAFICWRLQKLYSWKESFLFVLIFVGFFVVFFPWTKIFLFRIPAFFIGFYLASISDRKSDYSLLNSGLFQAAILFVLLSILVLVLYFQKPDERVEYGYIWIISAMAAYPTAFVFAFVFYFLDRLSKSICNLFFLLGALSFEFYLTHVLLFDLMVVNDFYMVFACFCFCVPVSFVLSKTVNFFGRLYG